MSVNVAERNDLKLKQEIFNSVNENVKALESLFPSAVKDGQVDFKALKEELGQFEEVEKEKYELTWSRKQNAKKQAQQDILGKTLKYIPEDSKNPETTENLYIEGDNLEVLKLLRQNYYGSIKMIYIDPPYNTGNDFVYNDKFSMTKAESDIQDGTISELGEKYTVNKDTSNKYHANWLNMMYPRLKVAKDLLTDDGIIFISIDDNEVNNLRKICDEIFSPSNFMSCIAVKMSEASGVKMTHANTKPPKLKEYILMYKKGENIIINPVKIPKKEWDNEYRNILLGVTKEEITTLNEIISNNCKIEKDNIIIDKILSKSYSKTLSEYFKENDIKNKDVFKFENSYRIFQVTATSIDFTIKIKEYIKINKITNEFFSYKTPTGEIYIIRNRFDDVSKKPRLQVLFANNYLDYNPGDFWSDIKTTGLDNEGEVPYKNGKKPIALIKRLIGMNKDKDSIILDFFSGSSTTADAVMQLNTEDGGNRKFIMVQVSENLDKSYLKAIGDTKKQKKL